MIPTAHLLSRKRRYIINDVATALATQIVSNWAYQLSYLGGTANPLPNTLNTVRDLVNGLIVDGIWPKVKLIFPYPVDNVTAISVPLINTGTSSSLIWTQSGAWGAGNLTINGAAGNGGQYMNNAIVAADLNSLSIGVIHYNYSVTATGRVTGSFSAPGPGIICGAQFSDGTYTSVLGDVTNNGIVGTSLGAGYYCHSRVSSTDHRLFFANSSTPHYQVGIETTLTTAAYPSYALTTHAVNGNGSVAEETQDRISFLAYCTGLTPTDSLNFFNRIQAYRKAVGGGFV